MSFDGILLIDKPVGWSSFDVVAKVRNVLRQEYMAEYGEKKKIKVGHTGTLDPLASGLMIVVAGSYCKRAGEFSKLDKTYEVEMKLGVSSSTGDEEGVKTEEPVREFSKTEILDAIKAFEGEIDQVPPAYSAVKINGQRAYKLAREGRRVEIQPRKVKIYSVELTKYAFPIVCFTARVGSGTYIRSLVEDIGKRLGTGAYMTNLRRITVGEFDISQSSLPSEELENKIIDHI